MEFKKRKNRITAPFEMHPDCRVGREPSKRLEMFHILIWVVVKEVNTIYKNSLRSSLKLCAL